MFNVSTLYRQSIKIAPSKVVVSFGRPIKALSMHIQKPYKGIIVQVLKAVILSKKKFQTDSFMDMFNASILYWQSIKLLH